MAKYVEPSITSRSFNCPHCGAHTGQTWFDIYCDTVSGENKVPFRASQELVESVREDKIPEEAKRIQLEYLERMARGEVFMEKTQKSLYSAPQLENVSISVCHICRAPAVWICEALVHPSTRSGAEPNEDMPSDVLADYEEARSIVSLSPRGAAALLRLCIQKLCDQLGQKGKKLDDAIAALVANGLDGRVQRALDIVRVIGNEAVHPGQIDLRDDHDMATRLFGLVNLIVEKTISEPKHIDALYEALPATKRKAIEKRDKRDSDKGRAAGE